MNVRAPAFIVVALALALASMVTSAFGQQATQKRLQPIAYAAEQRFENALRQAERELQKELSECNAQPVWSRPQCELEARDDHKNRVGLAKALLADDLPYRG